MRYYYRSPKSVARRRLQIEKEYQQLKRNEQLRQSKILKERKEEEKQRKEEISFRLKSAIGDTPYFKKMKEMKKPDKYDEKYTKYLSEWDRDFALRLGTFCIDNEDYKKAYNDDLKLYEEIIEWNKNVDIMNKYLENILKYGLEYAKSIFKRSGIRNYFSFRNEIKEEVKSYDYKWNTIDCYKEYYKLCEEYGIIPMDFSPRKTYETLKYNMNIYNNIK